MVKFLRLSSVLWWSFSVKRPAVRMVVVRSQAEVNPPGHAADRRGGSDWLRPRGLAGKPLAEFQSYAKQTYASRIRHGRACNTFQVPTVTSTIDVKKTTTWGESGFPSEFLGGTGQLHYRGCRGVRDGVDTPSSYPTATCPPVGWSNG